MRPYIKISNVTSKHLHKVLGCHLPVGPYDVVNYKVHRMKGQPRLHISADHSIPIEELEM